MFLGVSSTIILMLLGVYSIYLTGISTLLAALAIMIWGGFILYDFAFTFFCGVVIGTYASNFIASGLLILFMKTKKD